MKKKHPNISKNCYPMYKKWMIDYDYLNTLKQGVKSSNKQYAKECQEALDYLDKFSNEYYKGAFKKGEESLHPEELKKERFNANNANARDLHSYYYMNEYREDSDGDKLDDQ